MNKSFSISESFQVAWVRFREHTALLIGATILILIVSGVFDYLNNEVYVDIEPTSTLLGIISSVVYYWLWFGYMVMGFKIIDRQPVAMADLFVFDERLLRYFVASLLFMGLMIVGMIFFIVPGIYFLVRYGFFWYAIIDGNKDILASFAESSRITDGARWNVLLFGLASVGVVIAGFLLLGVGLLVATPVATLAGMHIYRVLLAASAVEVAPVSPPVATTTDSEAH